MQIISVDLQTWMMESFESYLYDIKHFWYWFVTSVIKRTYVLVSKQIELGKFVLWNL